MAAMQAGAIAHPTDKPVAQQAQQQPLRTQLKYLHSQVKTYETSWEKGFAQGTQDM